MLLGFKTELKLKLSQRVLLSKHAGTARHAWNWGLGLTRAILDNNQANPHDKSLWTGWCRHRQDEAGRKR